jgi:hypothetical protein
MPIELPTNDPCYFCQIIEGKTERWNVLEHTELTVTVLNVRQFEVGQSGNPVCLGDYHIHSEVMIQRTVTALLCRTTP